MMELLSMVFKMLQIKIERKTSCFPTLHCLSKCLQNFPLVVIKVAVYFFNGVQDVADQNIERSLMFSCPPLSLQVPPKFPSCSHQSRHLFLQWSCLPQPKVGSLFQGSSEHRE